MQIQAVNKQALARYNQLVNAIDMVRLALDSTDTVIRVMRHQASDRAHKWQVPTKDEVVGLRRKLEDQLEAFRAATKKHEKELIARGWRV